MATEQALKNARPDDVYRLLNGGFAGSVPAGPANGFDRLIRQAADVLVTFAGEIAQVEAQMTDRTEAWRLRQRERLGVEADARLQTVQLEFDGLQRGLDGMRLQLLPKVDPKDLAQARRLQETREVLQGLDPDARANMILVAIAAGEIETLQAVLFAPWAWGQVYAAALVERDRDRITERLLAVKDAELYEAWRNGVRYAELAAYAIRAARQWASGIANGRSTLDDLDAAARIVPIRMVAQAGLAGSDTATGTFGG